MLLKKKKTYSFSTPGHLNSCNCGISEYINSNNILTADILFCNTYIHNVTWANFAQYKQI